MAIMRNSCLALVFLTCIFSCGIDTTRKKKDRSDLIRALTKAQTDSLRIELDSICIEIKGNEFDRLVDSTLDARLVEIKEKLKEYHKE